MPKKYIASENRIQFHTNIKWWDSLPSRFKNGFLSSDAQNCEEG